MKKGLWKYLLAGVFIYLIGLLILLPAAQVYSLAGRYLPPLRSLQAHAIQGSIWSGHLSGLAWQNYAIGDLSWTIKPLPLLLARLSVKAQLRDEDASLNGHISLFPDRRLQLRDLRALLPAARLMTYNRSLPVALDGTLNARIDEGHLQANETSALRGALVWNKAQIIFGSPLDLGDLRLELEPDDAGGTRGTLSDAGGPLEIHGSIHLDKQWNYRLQAQLRARPSADPALAETLKLMGRPDGQGYHNLRHSARLPPL